MNLNSPTSPNRGEGWDTRQFSEVIEDIDALKYLLDERSMLSPEVADAFNKLIEKLDHELQGFIDANKS